MITQLRHCPGRLYCGTHIGAAFEEYVEGAHLWAVGHGADAFRQPPDELDGSWRGLQLCAGEYHEGGFEYIQGRPAGSLSSTPLICPGL